MSGAVTDPDAAPFRQASALHAAGDLPAAQAVLERLLAACTDAARPPPPDALNLLGIVYGQRGDPARACLWLAEAIAAGGPRPIYLRNLCELQRMAGDLPAAIAAGWQAVALAPDDVVARFNLAVAQADALDLGAAAAEVDRIIAVAPDHAGARFLRSEIDLVRGDLGAGWRNYGWRWSIQGAQRPQAATAAPAWDGQVLTGRLLLIGDQGFGDMIQFARFLPWAQARCTALTLVLPPELAGLLGRLAPGALVVTPDTPAGAASAEIAAQAVLSDLPALADTRLESLPAAPYLRADPARLARWTARLDQLAPRQGPRPARRVGLVWAGSARHRADRQRSMRLAALAPVMQLADTVFVALQTGEQAAQVGGYFGPAQLVNLGPECQDFEDTACALSLLDSLVSVDTACAHLAGALGCPAHVLLPFRPDWRWLLDRSDSPWYPSMTLHRDPGTGMRAAAVRAASDKIYHQHHL